jgi:POT family proton-dependent oligopeptide transporter
MAFHQNGNTLTLFARDYTQKTSEGLQSMAFDVTNLVACIFVVYGCFGLAQSKTGKGKGISLGVIVAAIAFLFYKYSNLEGAVDVEAPIFQQFNPCYVVALTPVSVALFSWLHKIGKEPTSPEKIGLGMLVAALGFVWMAVGKTQLIAKNNAISAANSTCGKGASPVVVDEKTEYNGALKGVLDEKTGQMVQAAAGILGSISGTNTGLNKDDDYQTVLTFSCKAN